MSWFRKKPPDWVSVRIWQDGDVWRYWVKGPDKKMIAQGGVDDVDAAIVMVRAHVNQYRSTGLSDE